VPSDNTLAMVRAIAVERDPGRASEIATAALQQGLRHPAFHSARAHWFGVNNRNAEALDELKQAVFLAPQDYELLRETGLVLLRLNRVAQAIAAFEAAIRIAPAGAQLHYLKGCAYSAAGEPAAALSSYERAIALEPSHADALAAAAAAGARAGEMAKSRRFAERALKKSPANPTAAVALAMCDLYDKEFARAEKHLGALLSELGAEDETRALALGLLGNAYDGQDRTDAAFEAYSRKNEILNKLYERHLGGDSRLLNRIERLVAGVEKISHATLRSRVPAISPARQHVFLLGFMRSGTTLLEQVLASHEDVETLEERETFAGVYPDYLGHAATSERLSLPSDNELDGIRENYWNRVRAFGAKPEGKVFVEKQPFNTIYLPLIARLFPSAKIVLQIRDPRDVILSCYRRHLEIKPTTFELLTLAGAARFYGRIMQFAALCRSSIPIEMFDCRYEDLVSKFDENVLAVCNHLGMEWADSMREFDRGARSRNIRSVSSNQVRQRLYRDGVGGWRRYEKQLSPIFPLLQPWIERFGYSAD